MCSAIYLGTALLRLFDVEASLAVQVPELSKRFVHDEPNNQGPACGMKDTYLESWNQSYDFGIYNYNAGV
jgi:hypothetical protein